MSALKVDSERSDVEDTSGAERSDVEDTSGAERCYLEAPEVLPPSRPKQLKALKAAAWLRATNLLTS